MKKLVAIIVGGTGQYGIFTGKLLLSKNYKVIITTRSTKKKLNILKPNKNLILQKLNIYDKKKIEKLILKFKPNLIFYYAGQSSPDKSFKLKKETFKSNFVGCKNFLDIINKKKINCKFLNATSCEIFGKINGKIKVSSIKRPVNPYGLSKLKSYEITKNYRIRDNLKSYNAIIFNTESILRDKNFLIPKICNAAVNAEKYGFKTEFGNLNISREWNWCPEQVEYIYKFLKKKPQDFILSNGKNYSAIKMMKFAFEYFNLDYKKYVLINRKFFRKKDVNNKKSSYIDCLKRNKIKRNSKIYGEKIINLLVKNYLNEKRN